MKKNGFTLIEVSIVLIIVGILLALGIPMVNALTRKAKFVESRETVRSAREALSGQLVKSGTFAADPLAKATPKTTDAWGKNLLFYADDRVWGAGKDVCGVTTTLTKLKECSNDACSAFNTKDNIAFIVYSNSEDADGVCTGSGVCTGGAGTCIFPTCTGTCTAGVCSGGAGTCPTCSATPGAYCTFPVWQQGAGYNSPCTYAAANPAFQYDDIVQYVTLDELRLTRGCQFRITNTSLPDARVGTAYSATVQATGDGSATYTWSTGQPQGGCAVGRVQLVATDIGLCLTTATGAISGTPTTAGANNFTVTATNASNSTVSQAFTLNVADTLAITNQTLPNALTWVSYSVSLNATGGNPPYTWSSGNAQGACPAGTVQIAAINTGLCLNTASGLISGAIVANPFPLIDGTWNITATVTDANAKSASKEFTLTIEDRCSLQRGGMLVQNRLGSNRYYKKNGGTCTTVANNANMTLYSGDVMEFFSNASCGTEQCTAQELSFDNFKSWDSNFNCAVGWTAQGATCTFAGAAP